MVLVKAIFKNGDSITTRINGDFENAKNWYLNNYFNLGVVEDNMQQCIDLILIKEF